VVGHRKPVDLVPERLKTFRREDWETPNDTDHFDALHSWKRARAEWVASHPHNLALGDASTRMRVELVAQMGQYNSRASSWEEYQR
jgi:hypothetical protein